MFISLNIKTIWLYLAVALSAVSIVGSTSGSSALEARRG